jgi:hypothetical protein
MNSGFQNSTFGGTLNNGVVNGYFSATDQRNTVADANPKNLKGADGVPFLFASTDPFIFGDGHGNGVTTVKEGRTAQTAGRPIHVGDRAVEEAAPNPCAYRKLYSR